MGGIWKYRLALDFPSARIVGKSAHTPKIDSLLASSPKLFPPSEKEYTRVMSKKRQKVGKGLSTQKPKRYVDTMKTKTLTVAVVGATGLVGNEILKVLAERNFPVGKVLALATARSAGKEVTYQGKPLLVEEAKLEAFRGVQIAFFAGGDKSSEQLAKDLAKQGTVVIDNSSTFRMDPEVPLVVPEVNPHALLNHHGIIANPNCSTIQLAHAVKPIADAVEIEHLVVSTYQAVSGTGKEAVEELREQSVQAIKGEEVERRVYPHQIAFNCLPQAWTLDQATLYTEEERKVVQEMKKILEKPNFVVSVTTVRVPVFRGHGEAVYVMTKEKLTRERALELWRNFPGIQLIEEPENRRYPTPLDAEGTDLTYVGHVREDLDYPRGLFFWVVADNLRKGAATNAIQIAEKLLGFGLI
jgi:aspartate-semialdehyde dehydrogenase